MDEMLPVCKLSFRQRQILKMLDEGEELVYEKGGGWWIGNDRTNGKLPLTLIKHLCISQDDYSNENFQRWHINETGKNSLKAGWLYTLNDTGNCA